MPVWFRVNSFASPPTERASSFRLALQKCLPMGARTPFSAASAPLIGHTVTLSGLKSRLDLNGTTGTVLSFLHDKGRYAVQSSIDGAKICLKPESLEFVRPGVEFVDTLAGRGRGVVASVDIAAGELVVASRALATTDGSEAALVTVILEKAKEQKSEVQFALSQLSGGPRFPAKRPFDTGRASPGSSAECTEELDIHRVKAIVGENCFACIPSSREWVSLFLEHGKEVVANMGTRGRGVWVLPSAFNHSCLSNAVWETIGAMLFVRTVRAVRAGEEICIPYLQPSLSFEARSAAFEAWNQPYDGGFSCVCETCDTLRTNSSVASTERVMARVRQMDTLMRSRYSENSALSGKVMPTALERCEIHKLSELPLVHQRPLMNLLQAEVGESRLQGDHRRLYECDRAYSRLKSFFDGEALYGQAQFSDLKDKLRLASYAYMLGMEENVREHLIAARTRSLATSNLTLDDFFRVLEKDCEGAPDAELRMSLARQYVKA